MMMEFKAYAVGEYVCSPRQEGVTFEFLPDGAILLIAYNSPTSKEISTVKSGLYEFKISEVNNIMFLLSRFGTLNWMDSPFCAFYAQYDLHKLKIENENEGIALHVLLVDASTGKLKAQRIIGLQHDFSENLISASLRQLAPASRSDYNNALQQVYLKYDTMDLVNMAIATNG
jgi:hypothetical protein